MNVIQQYLFPEMNDDIERARDQVLEESAPAETRDNFVRNVQAAIAKAPAGGVVAVGCSAVANQREVIDAILKMPQREGAQARSLAAAEIVMPPCVTGSREQSRVLFDRYSTAVSALNLPYRFEPLFSGCFTPPPPSSRSENVISTLLHHDIRIVFITDAHNIDSAADRFSDTDRMLRQLSDIASRSKVVHVLIGEMAALWNAVSRSRIVSQIQMVMQPMYDPDVKADHMEFLVMLKKQQNHLSRCTAVDLSRHYADIMKRTVGDYARVAQWLADALCEAARKGCANLDWSHLKATAPRLEQTNDALRALNAFRAFRKGTAFDFCECAPAPTATRVRAKLKLKPFEPKPRRDMVGDAGANAA